MEIGSEPGLGREMIYLVFAGKNFYPTGAEDLIGMSGNFDEAKQSARQLLKKHTEDFDGNDWASVVEMDAEQLWHKILWRCWGSDSSFHEESVLDMRRD